MHSISRKRLDAIRLSYLNYGLNTRIHSNANRLPHNAYTTEELKHTVTFIKNYAETHGILLPGRIPGYKRIDIQLLPTHMTKRGVWNDYIRANGPLSRRIAGYMSFIKIWKKIAPHVVITKPRSDLCWICQRNFVAITQAANSSESHKLQINMNDNNKGNNDNLY